MTLKAHDLVRIAPQNSGGNNRSAHWHRGKIVSVNGSKAVVHPFGHRGTEVIDVKHLKLWKSKNPDRKEETMAEEAAELPAEETELPPELEAETEIDLHMSGPLEEEGATLPLIPKPEESRVAPSQLTRRQRIEQFRHQRLTIQDELLAELQNLDQERKDAQLLVEQIDEEIVKVREDLRSLGYAVPGDVPEPKPDPQAAVTAFRSFYQEKEAVMQILKKSEGVWLDATTIRGRAGVLRPLSILLKDTPEVEAEGSGKARSYRYFVKNK